MNIGEDLVVVGPCWGGDVDGWGGFGKELGEKEAAEMDCTSTRNRLEGDGLLTAVCQMMCSWCGAPVDRRGCQTYSILFDSWTVFAQDELLSSRGKLCQACDG